MNISYKLKLEQEKKLKSLLSDFEKTAFVLSEFSEEKITYIKQCSFISNIGASTRIENAVLTDVEIDWIDTEIRKDDRENFAVEEKFIKNKLSADKERSIEEVAGYRGCLKLINDQYKDFVPLRKIDVKAFHKEILKYYSRADYHLGDYKKHTNKVIEKDYLTGREVVVLDPAPPGIFTEDSMKELIDWYNGALNNEVWPVAVAVELVLRFLAIHPFQDGNGRISRLLFQLILICSEDKCFNKVMPYVGLDRCIEQTRSQYYKVLKKSTDGKFKRDPKKYKYNYFFDYMIDILRNSLDNFDYYVKKYENYITLSNTSLEILKCFKNEPEVNLQTKDIVKKLGIPRRTVIYSLNSLSDKGFIQRLGQGRALRYKITF
ncbi:MAG: Fic family protein [Deltaproteobacteria bacterium]|nr:Fic family protein [Deltaproteobacteria bacterium]